MLEWAVTSSVLILAVLLLRQCLKGKVSLRLQYGLWALVLLRLLIPVSFGSTAVSVLNAVERVEDRVPAPAVSYIGGETPDLAPAEPDPSLPPAEQQTQYEQHLAQWQAELDAARAETGTPVTVGMVLMLLWAAGAALLGLWLVGVNLCFRRALVRSRKSLAVEGFPLPVYVTGAVPTPCLFGLVRPAVYVTPEAAADGTVLRHSLAHELTHFRHRDHLWAALRGLCLALHWYNPLVWLAAGLSRRDGELCCDEATVKRLGEGERAAYGRTLLAVTCQGRADPLLTATSMTGSGKGIQERIVLLARRPKTAARSLALVVLVAAAAVGCTFTGAEEDGFVPDRVSMGQALSSTSGSTITDPETVARLWDLYQGFTLGEPADPDDVWTLSVGFSAEDTEKMVGFILTPDGLYSIDWEAYYVLEDGAELYQEFYGVYEEQQARDREAELSREEDEPSDTYLTSADLDRDGEDETISVVQKSQQIWQLVVTKSDGTELFREDAGTPHVGWNSLYLCRDDQNGDCLLRYHPYTSTGFASYAYTLFTLEGGAQTVIQEGSLDFEIRQVPERVEELMTFADEVNALLRHSSLLLSTQDGEVRIGLADWGEDLEHLSGLGDFLTEEELEEYRSAFWPEIMEGEQVVSVNPVSAFFTSYYERPEELNFEEFLRYLPGSELVKDDPDDPEFQTLTAHPLWPFEGGLIPVPIHRYPRQSVNEVLERYAGITTQDLSGVGMDNVIYLEEYDAWYNFTSDYGPGIFNPAYGLREGTTVRLWERPSGSGTPGDVLTLEETEDGFRICSHLPGDSA